MEEFKFKHILGWFYLTIAFAGMVTMAFVDPIMGFLIVIFAYVAKSVENTAIIIALTEDPNNE